MIDPHVFPPKNLEKLVDVCVKKIETGDCYSLFALRRISSGNYVSSGELKKEFDRYLLDEDFCKLNYMDITASPLRLEDNSPTWPWKIRETLIWKRPQNLIFYIRDNKITTARILIPVPDFYGGLTIEEATKKYGKDLMKKMNKEIGAITFSKDFNDQLRIPFGDLDRAFKRATGKSTSPLEWD